MPLIPVAGMLANTIPEGHGHFATVLLWTRAMAYRARHGVLHQQPALIADRHRLATAWLSNNAGKRSVAFNDSPRTA